MQQADIMKLEQLRRDTMVRADVNALSTLLADDLAWIHGTGRADNKAGILASIQSGKTKYMSFNSTDESVRFYGPVALISGNIDANAEIAGEKRLLQNRFTVIWAQQANGEWQVANWQSTNRKNP